MTAGGSGETAGLAAAHHLGVGLPWPQMHFNLLRMRLVLINANDQPTRMHFARYSHMNAHRRLTAYEYPSLTIMRKCTFKAQKQGLSFLSVANYHVLPSLFFTRTSLFSSV